MEIIRTTILGLKRITVGLLAAGFIIGILAGLAYGLGYSTSHLLSLDFHNQYLLPGLIELSALLFVCVAAFYVAEDGR